MPSLLCSKLVFFPLFIVPFLFPFSVSSFIFSSCLLRTLDGLEVWSNSKLQWQNLPTTPRTELRRGLQSPTHCTAGCSAPFLFSFSVWSFIFSSCLLRTLDGLEVWSNSKLQWQNLPTTPRTGMRKGLQSPTHCTAGCNAPFLFPFSVCSFIFSSCLLMLRTLDGLEV